MPVVRMRGLKIYTHPVSGIVYCYHRATGKRIHAKIGTPEFLREVAAAEAARGPKPDAIPGTLGKVIDQMKDSPDWRALKEATRVSYTRAGDALHGIHDMPLASIDRPFIVRLRDRLANSRGRWMANYAAVTFLSVLFEFAKDRGWAKANPAMGAPKLKRDKARPKANRPWTPDECRAVLNAASPGVRLALALALFAGMRKADALTLQRAAIIDGRIRYKTSKGDEQVAIPIHPDLAAILRRDMRHKAETVCASSRGEPWTADGLDSAFQRLITKLEAGGAVAPGLTIHGARHTAATRLREAGADTDLIRRALGQRTVAMAQHYSEDADMSSEMRPAVLRMNVLGKKRERRLSTRATM